MSARAPALAFAAAILAAACSDTTAPAGLRFAVAQTIDTLSPARAIAALPASTPSRLALLFELEDRATLYEESTAEYFRPGTSATVGSGPRVLAASGSTLATADLNGKTITVLELTPNGTLIVTASIALPLPPVHLAAADLDGDGTPELAAALGLTDADDRIQIFRTGGEPLGDAIPIPGANRLALGDLDGDGDLDLAALEETRGTLRILANDGTGRFQDLGERTTCEHPFAARVADLDQSGTGDLIVACRSGGLDLLFDPARTPAGATAHLAEGTSLYDVAIADFDRDGILDLAAADVVANQVIVWRGIGGGKVGGAETYDVGRGPIALAAIDAAGDGDIDLAVLTFEARAFDVLSNRSAR